MIKRILSLGADITAKDSSGNTPYAYLYGSNHRRQQEIDVYEYPSQTEVVRYVAEDKEEYFETPDFWGADVYKSSIINKIKNDKGQTDFHLAALQGDFEQFRKILPDDPNSADYKRGNLSIKDKDGRTALSYAVTKAGLDIVDIMYRYQVLVNQKMGLSKMIDISNQRDKKGQGLLHHVMSIDAKIKVVEFLLGEELKLNANVMDNEGRSPIFTALQNNRIDLSDLILRNGANINLVDKNGNTPLREAVKNGKTAIVEFIINNGGDPQLKNKDGKNAFDVIDQKEHPEIREILAERNRIKVTENAIPSVSPAFQAIKDGNLNNLKLFLAQGADINQQDRNGDSLLHVAIRLRNKEIIKFLKDQNPDLSVRNKENQTCIDFLDKNKHPNIAKLVLGTERKLGLSSTNIVPNNTPKLEKTKGKKLKEIDTRSQ